MTREEARDQIVIFMCDEQKVINDRDKQALEMAIQALEQEPSEDAISRDAVLDYIHRILNQGTGKKKSFEFIRKYVEKLPPVKPQKSRTEPKYCDRNICLRNEYNNIGCDECEVTKSQEPSGDLISRQDDRGVSLKSVKHVLYDICLHEDNMALFSELLDRVNKLRDWEEYLTIKQQPCEDAISRQAVLDIVDSYSVSQSNVEDVTQDIISDIMVLSSINPQPCEDAISRQAVLEMAYDMSEIDGEHFTEPCMVVDVEDIQKLLPVKPQEKTGHWIQTNEFFINQDGQFIYKFICSECKSLSYFRKSNKKAIGANVCPNCGAKMVKEQERNDKE